VKQVLLILVGLVMAVLIKIFFSYRQKYLRVKIRAYRIFDTSKKGEI